MLSSNGHKLQTWFFFQKVQVHVILYETLFKDLGLIPWATLEQFLEIFFVIFLTLFWNSFKDLLLYNFCKLWNRRRIECTSSPYHQLDGDGLLKLLGIVADKHHEL